MKQKVKKDGALRALTEKLNIKNINVPARSSLFFTITNLACKAAAFLFTPVFTRLLSPLDYGEYSLFSTLLSLSAVLATMEISGGIIMRLFQKERKRHFLSILSAWAISVWGAIPITAALWLINKLGGIGMSFTLAYPFLFAAVISISLINLFVSRCKFLYSWIPPLITSLMQSVTAPIISIALLRINSFTSAPHVTVKIGAVTSVLVITAAYILVLTVKNASLETKEGFMNFRDTLKFMRSSVFFLLRLALPLFPYYVSIMAISQADKLFISSLIGKSELAKYSVAYSAGVAPTAITSGIMSALSPWIMRRARADEYRQIRKTLDRMTTASVPLIILFLCLAPEFFVLLAPKEYMSALPVLFISAIIPIPLALAQCSSSIAIANEKVRGVLFSGIVPALLTVALDFLIVGRSQIYAAAIITAIGFLLLAALGIANIKKITGHYTVNVNKAFQNLLFLLLLVITVYTFREFIFIRIGIAALSATVILLLSKDIISLFREKET
ncbi:MAG: hypothetical protein E7673_06800 [Ruminococcaceae bacterium]|nr:hypothetical protein [Oscillospiraceae bacterium]